MKFSAVIVAVVFCIFLGILGISVGLGAAFPQLNLIAKPFVCPDGAMTSSSRVYKPYPGKNVLSRSWYCVQGESETPLSLFPIAMVAGTIYGLVLFVILKIIGLLRRKTLREA